MGRRPLLRTAALLAGFATRVTSEYTHHERPGYTCGGNSSSLGYNRDDCKSDCDKLARCQAYVKMQVPVYNGHPYWQCWYYATCEQVPYPAIYPEDDYGHEHHLYVKDAPVTPPTR
jgi:hypothetical protein